MLLWIIFMLATLICFIAENHWNNAATSWANCVVSTVSLVGKHPISRCWSGGPVIEFGSAIILSLLETVRRARFSEMDRKRRSDVGDEVIGHRASPTRPLARKQSHYILYINPRNSDTRLPYSWSAWCNVMISYSFKPERNKWERLNPVTLIKSFPASADREALLQRLWGSFKILPRRFVH